MSKSTVTTVVAVVSTGVRFALSYPEFPERCDHIHIQDKSTGESLTITADQFQENATGALNSIRQFMGDDLSDPHTFVNIEGVPDYRVAIGSEDIQFASYENGNWWETAYWYVTEFVDDAAEVLGAICGALRSVDAVDEDSEPATAFD